MTKDGLKKFIIIVGATYPQAATLNTPEAVAVWLELLADIPDEVAMQVLKEWCGCNKWPPTIADIRDGAVKVVHGELPDWGDAWESVLNAVRKYGRYNEHEALATLDEVTKNAVENIGFVHICNAEEDELSYLKHDFENLYKIKADRKKRELQTPTMIAGATLKTLKGE